MELYKRIERELIRHCSPTLASLKTASLFTLEFANRSERNGLNPALREWNKRLSDKGVAMLALREMPESALIYVFRIKKLQSALCCPKAEKFLKENGYESASIGTALAALRARLARLEGFPHEIGIFLGYPPDDVIGFIKNNGRNCKYAGCWKVYRNEREAVKAFARFKKCEAVYMRLWEQGRTVRQLTVAA